MHLTFLTPWGLVLALGALLPLGALVLNERRAARARRALDLAAPPARTRLSSTIALAAVPILLGLALAQPVLQSEQVAHMRSDAQAFYVFDTSESMRAAAGPGRTTRLARAVAMARELHAGLDNVPSGVGTITDRVLPNIFPTSSESVFTAALGETIGIDRPPPKGFSDTATTFAALDTFVGSNFFDPGIHHRLVILFTDGESAPYFGGDLHRALLAKPRTSFVIVRLGSSGERIYAGGKVDRAYRPDPAAAHATRRLAAFIGGRAFSEGNVDGTLAAAHRFLGRGPLTGIGEGLHVVALSRWLVLAAAVPLLFLLWRRNLA